MSTKPLGQGIARAVSIGTETVSIIPLAAILSVAGCAGPPNEAGVGEGSTVVAGFVETPEIRPPSIVESEPPAPDRDALADACRAAAARHVEATDIRCGCIAALADRTLDGPGRRLLGRALASLHDPTWPIANHRAELNGAAVESGSYLRIDAFVQAIRTACGQDEPGS